MESFNESVLLSSVSLNSDPASFQKLTSTSIKSFVTLEPSTKTRHPKSCNIPPGRLSITCIKACNIPKENTSSQSRSYLFFKCKSSSYNGQNISSVVPISLEDDSLNFDHETLHFDFINSFFLSSVPENDIEITIQLWDKQSIMSTTELPAPNDKVLGEVTLNASRFFQMINKSHNEWFPFQRLGSDGIISKPFKINLEIIYQKVSHGKILLTLIKGEKLGTGLNSKHSSPTKANNANENTPLLYPFVKFSFSDQTSLKLISANNSEESSFIENNAQRSRIARREALNSYTFSEEKITLDINEENLFQKLEISLWNNDRRTEDEDLIGKCFVNLIPYMNESNVSLISHETTFICQQIKEHVHTKKIKKNDTGEIQLKMQFFEAGDLNVRILNGNFFKQDIIDNGSETIEMFILLRATNGSQDKSSLPSFKTKPMLVEDGAEVQWNFNADFKIVDQFRIMLECYSFNSLSCMEDKISFADISLLPIFKYGFIDTWVDLKYKNEYGKVLDRGQLHIQMRFNAPKGVSFPQNQPTIVSFDEKHRENSFTNVKKVRNITSEEPEYTEGDIQNCFRFIDLDKNKYLGAAEIKHILICMGELVTDEEIDMMITMLDKNGDGQVSIDEFRAMVLDPDPSRDDFKTETYADSKPFNADMVQKEKEILKRDAKRKSLAGFVSTYNVNKDRIMVLVDDYFLSSPFNEELMTYIKFCDLFAAQPASGETRQLFQLFDYVGSGLIDLRELILSICNFLPNMTVEERCSVIFNMYDEDRSDTLCRSELERILAGNHMQSKSSVMGKINTVMKFADTDGSGEISLPELISLFRSLPNLLVPNHDQFQK